MGCATHRQIVVLVPANPLRRLVRGPRVEFVQLLTMGRREDDGTWNCAFRLTRQSSLLTGSLAVKLDHLFALVGIAAVGCMGDGRPRRVAKKTQQARPAAPYAGERLVACDDCDSWDEGSACFGFYGSGWQGCGPLPATFQPHHRYPAHADLRVLVSFVAVDPLLPIARHVVSLNQSPLRFRR